MEVEGLRAGYRVMLRRRPVLDGVDFSLAPGTATGLVGLNGAGKTTLLRILLGFLSPWAGQVRICGETPRVYRRRRGVGYLPESLHLPSSLSVEELVEVGARLSRSPAGKAAVHVEELIRLARLEGLARRKLSHLSRGQARLAGLAFALTGSPALLLLDEPESGLDPHSRTALRGALWEVVSRGCTVLVSSHDLSELEKITERVLVLEGGQITREVATPRAGGLESLLLSGPAANETEDAP